MKILWFTNSPCGSIKRNPALTVKSGGWLISLEAEIKKEKNIQLEVAYFSDKHEKSFAFENVKYYPMCRNKFDAGKGLSRIRERFISQEDKDKKALPIMLDVARQSQPDIIHIHGTEEAFGLLVKYIKDIPIVFSIQGMIAPYREKYFSGIPKKYAYKFDLLCDKIKGVGIKKSYQSFCYRAEREKQYLSQANYIFGRTFWDRDCTLALNPKRKYYVVNEILRPEFYKKQWKGFFSNNVIKIVSTISGGIYKGMETVLKAACLLKQYGNLKFEWHIAGYTSSTKWVRICEKMTGVLAKDCNIIFHGRIDAELLSDLLCKSDIYVHVSHIENSPNSVCEAMILGMPVIASYAGGTASLLKHEEDGILYQDGDPYVLAGAIIEMQQNPTMAYKYAQTAREHALNRHDKKQIVKEVIEGYSDIISNFCIGK